MKKTTIIDLIVLIIVSAATVSLFCYFSHPQRTKRADIVLGESEKFSRSEVEAAAKCVFDYFSDRDDMYLKKVWYDEEASNESIRNYIANGIEETNIIIIFTNHHTNHKYITGPNMDYNKYVWILIKDAQTGNWEIYDSGAL